MKTKILVLITAITFILTDTVIAENHVDNLPPSGPYRSMNSLDHSDLYQNSKANPQLRDKQNYSSSQSDQPDKEMRNNYSAEIPEWVKQRQTEMDNWMRQKEIRQQAEWRKQSLQQPEVPEWVKQQQAQMKQDMKRSGMLPPQNWNNQRLPQWNPNHVPPMPNHRPNTHGNGAQQYFPSARGPVFGPDVPPPGFNNRQGYQAPQYRNTYPPVWR